MTETTARTARTTAAKATNPAEELPTEALKAAGQKLLALLIQRAAGAATERVEDLSDRLTELAERGGPGTKAALRGGVALAQGQSPVRAALRGGLADSVKSVAESVKSRLGSTGGGKKLKTTVISEDQDIGLPLRTTYDLWTRFSDFPSYTKKVESVEQADDRTTNWKAQVLWSHRTWEATTVEQVPDSHIVWRSKGRKGHVDGAVTFTELGPNLTRVLLVLEYHPQGLFERTGNLWRAQGRRARLEFQHFRRHAMTTVLTRKDEVEGWRGEIRDSEVVVTHEDAVRAEQDDEDREPQDYEPRDYDEPADDIQDEIEDDYDEEGDEHPQATDQPVDEDDPGYDTAYDTQDDTDGYDDQVEPVRTGRGR